MNAPNQPHDRRTRAHCTCLGQVTIDDVSAELFVCDDLVIARFGDGPGEVDAAHLHTLTPGSSAFLHTALRLYLRQLERPRRSWNDRSQIPLHRLAS